MERLAKLEKDKNSKIDQTKDKVQNSLKDLTEQERALEGLKLRELDPALLEIVKNAEERTKSQLIRQKSELNSNKELDKLKDANNIEKERLLKEFDDRNKAEEQYIADELEWMRRETVKAICGKKEELEAHKATFLKKLADTTTDEEKDKLMKEHDAFNNRIRDDIDKMSFEGAIALENKAAEIWDRNRKDREAALKKLFDEHDKKYDNLEKTLKEQELAQRGSLEDQTIEDVVRSLKRQYSNEEIPPALEKILDDRHMKELMNLLMRQYKEKSQIMKDNLIRILDQKADALDGLKKEFAHSKLMLKEAYEKGGINEE